MNNREMAMNHKDSENPIWYRSSSSTQRLPAMGLAGGSGTGRFGAKVLKESRTWQQIHLSNWMSSGRFQAQEKESPIVTG